MKNGDTTDIISALRKKAEISDDIPLRIFETHSNKIHKILPDNYSVVSINEFVTLFAEQIPEEEVELSDSDSVIPCFHFEREPSRSHSIPFTLLVKEVLIDCPAHFAELTFIIRAKYSARPRNVYRYGQESRAYNSRKSNLLS